MFMAFQTVVIAFLVQFYSGKTARAFGLVILYVGAMTFFLSPLVPFQMLSLIQTCNIFVIATSKVRDYDYFCLLFEQLCLF
jgi:hypothetical protein